MPQWHLQTSYKDPFERVITSKGDILSCKSVKPCKSRKNARAYYIRTRDKSGSNSPPFQRNVQIPPSPGTMFQMPEGGDVEVSNWSAHYTVVVGGDFDVIFNQDLIGSGCIKRVKGSVTFLDNNYREHNLVDIWRVGNHTAKRFTWRQKNPFIQRR